MAGAAAAREFPRRAIKPSARSRRVDRRSMPRVGGAESQVRVHFMGRPSAGYSVPVAGMDFQTILARICILPYLDRIGIHGGYRSLSRGRRSRQPDGRGAPTGRSLQSVNRSLASLERSVGVELVRRTTRQSFATEAGLAFYRRVKPAFAEISEARLEAANRRLEPSGVLRIASPVVFGSTYVVPAIAEFLVRYAQIEAGSQASDRPIDVVADGFDLAIRISELPDSSLRARRLGTASHRCLWRAELFRSLWSPELS